MQEFTTPMMKQYMEIKKQYQDCLLFYRMGDFYELFLEDAHIGARILNITLTGKSNGKSGRIPMAGVPYHAVDSYLAKLVKAGYKVAICEQVSLPQKYGLVEREVVRVVTPGTMLDEKALEKKENNYIISLSLFEKGVAFSVADLSTGYFATTEIISTDPLSCIKDELSRIHPAECILSDALYNDPDLLKTLRVEKGVNIFSFPQWDTYASRPEEILSAHFKVKTLEAFGIIDKPQALATAAALLGYLQITQKAPVQHIKKISSFHTDDSLVLDRSTILNLELFSTIREHDSKGTLLSVLDHTKTAMGGRLLKQWLKKPLASKKLIEDRLDVVELLLKNTQLREKLQEEIQNVSDIERMLSRLSVGLGNARDLINLSHSLTSVVTIKTILSQQESTLLQQLASSVHEKITHCISLISTHIVPEPPIGVREGCMIQEGIHKELDRLRKIVGGSKEWILEMEKKEKEKTGITSLKVRFNKVFGFYIEVSKSYTHLVPASYMRKQTLVNGERFITPELKEQEEIILASEEKIHELEYQLFTEIVTKILSEVLVLQDAASAVAVLDCLLSFVQITERHSYVRPKLLYSGEIRIKEGRHPVVEQLLPEKQFVPNDVTLDTISQSLILLTGPNMAGKSVFIRQVALIVLMAQMGCFVPAKQAHIALVDRIFVRSGASDVITSGLSTFMVEMVETAHILHNATKNSLIIMDEIGRGTSTYDGISIAWAVAEYLVKKSKTSPKTLFATHYHELQALEDEYPKQIKNFHMAVAQEKDEPIFLHTILPGGASHSFGVVVAKLAGVPEEVVQRANGILKQLEARSSQVDKPVISMSESADLSAGRQGDPLRDVEEISQSFLPRNDNHELTGSPLLVDRLIHKELEHIDISQMTPLEALNKLADLKEKIKLFEKQQENYLKAD